MRDDLHGLAARPRSARNKIADQYAVEATERHPNKRDDERVDDGFAAFGEDHLVVP